MRINLFLLLLIILITPVLGQEQGKKTNKEELSEHMKIYFRAEYIESTFFIGLGTGALIFGAFALTGKKDFLKGAAYPVIGLGLIQLTVGMAILLRTDSQLATLQTQLTNEPTKYKQEEFKRMQVVNYWFDIYKILEISLLVGGVATAVIANNANNEFVAGVGVGLAAESALMLVLDFFAESRADLYTEQIGNLQVYLLQDRMTDSLAMAWAFTTYY